MVEELITVQVLGRKYKLAYEVDEEQVRKVIDFVGQKMNETSARYPNLDLVDVAVFTAFNLGHDLFSLQEECENLRRNLETVNQRLQEVLEEKG